MLHSIANDFRKGIVDENKTKKIKKDPFKHFNLVDAVGVRPSVLKYILPLDDSFLYNVAVDVMRSKDAGKRMGVEWMPASAKSFEHKTTSDDHWVTNEQLKPLNDVCTKWCTKSTSLTHFRESTWWQT